MKLISITILVLSFSRNGISNEQFVFPPKFQNGGQFVSDSTLYLPPESHTPIPYFPIKKLNNLPFPYLPPTGTKSPVPYPPSFPLMLSSTLAPKFDDDDDDKDDERDNKILLSSPSPQMQYRNRTERVQEDPTLPKRDIRPIPKMFNYQHPIDRVDIKFPPQGPNVFQSPNPNPNQTSRSMIISAENHRNDFLEQIKAASSQNPHFISPPGVFISSTEPAIPIVRLSNEMDLDGSFSYEALGADQTHYVQHSHMENLGTDKAEQVVEGSYSYVGDNGQTYTVHYIADSNGFRATGDHLPVAPPIPEIIQRSIQYNLAEEAKKPQHLKSWQPDDQERDFNEISEKSHRFSIPPPRNLFTGRTPEAFSYDFSQRSNVQNNLATAASSQIQMKTIADFTNNQTKANNHSPILPQVTFLASQGAHIPSMNSPPQSVSRMFTTEKSIMPQLMNYEADDNNKALWRWQYGLNSNNANQTPEKNSISRSFGEGDDVMINFSEMTPDQYTKMIQSQVSSNPSENTHTSHHLESSNTNDNTYNYLQNNPENTLSSDNYENQKYDTNKASTGNDVVSTEKITTQASFEGWYKPQSDSAKPHFYQMDQTRNSIEQNQKMHEQNIDTNTKLKSEQGFFSTNKVLSSTQEYNYEDSSYEPKRFKTFLPVTMKPYNNNINQITNSEYDKMMAPSYSKIKTNEMKQETEFIPTHVTPIISTESNIKFSDFITHDYKDNFKPILETNNENKHVDDTVNSEIINESKLNNNIFLAKLFNAKKNEQKAFNKMVEDTEKQLLINNKNNDRGVFNKAEQEKPIQNQSKKNEPNLYNLIREDERYVKAKNAETKSDKISPYVNVQNKPIDEDKSLKKKPLDISDVLNYITMKNHFESNKVRPKNNPINFGNYNHRNEMHYIPVHETEDIVEDKGYSQKQNTNNNRHLYIQPGELRGNIKNYKVLQRQNNIISTGYDNDEITRELVPPPRKLKQAPNLPPLGRAGPSTRSYLPPIYI